MQNAAVQWGTIAGYCVETLKLCRVCNRVCNLIAHSILFYYRVKFKGI